MINVKELTAFIKGTFLSKIILLTLVILPGIFMLSGCGSKGEPIDFEMDGKQLLYKGSKQEDLAHGYGSLYLGSQLLYEGEFVEGWIEGQGKLYVNGKIKYKGQFQDGEALGEGTIYNKDGKKMFSGQITENDGNNYQGVGYLHNRNGEAVYHGAISVVGDNVKVADQGQLLYPTGKVFYEGELKDGLPQGKGTYYDLKGNVIIY